MNPMTAACFIICGYWMVLAIKMYKQRAVLLKWISIFIILFGLAHTVIYEYDVYYQGMGFLLFNGKLKIESNGDLIPPNTALGFILSGSIMLLTSSRKQWIQWLRQASIIVIFLVSYASILGYLFHIQPEYALGGLTPMSLLTAVSFLILSVGLLISSRRYTLTRLLTSGLNSSRMLRVALPFIFILPPLKGYLRLMGEEKKYYPAEFGVELNTMGYIVSVFVFLSLYAALENKKQIIKLRTDLRLAARESQYKALFNSIKEGVVSVNFRGKILYCNPSFCQITGYTESELIGKNAIEQFIPPSYQSEFMVKFEERRTGTQENYQAEIKKKDGEKIWVTLKSKPLNDHNGVQYGYIASVDDITEDILKIQDLQAFTASAAHDLNSPLARIITIADIFESTAIDDEQKELMDILSKTALGMRELLKDLLLFSKLGSEHLDKKTVDMNALVRETCDELVPADFPGKITKNHLPEIEGNEAAIRRLLANLISNAIKYSSDKNTPVIEIGIMSKHEPLIYYVKDNGLGLDDESIRNLFTPFKRFHSGIEGNGMGLAIVKRIVEKHGGYIWAKQNNDSGLTFYFSLSS